MRTEADDRRKAWRPILLSLLIAACLIVRLVALDADPPPWLSWSTGLYTDEGFYTLDARHETLFGAWAPGNFHDRLLSPLLSLLQQGAFVVFGPSLRTARLLSIAFGLLTIFVLWLGLRQTYGRTVADFGALFLGLAPPFALYNRLALQETPTVFWLVLSFALWAYGRNAKREQRRCTLLALAGAALGMAFVFKALALLALPAFVWAWWGTPSGSPKLATSPEAGEAESQRAWRLSREVRLRHSPSPFPKGEGRWLANGWGLYGLVAVLLLYGLFWYAPHHAELARMSTYYRTHQYQPHGWRTVWLNIRRGFVGGERGVFPYLLAFLPIPVLLAGWGMAGRDLVRRVLAGWLLCGVGFCLLSTYAPDRYYVLFLPALAGLAACGLARLSRAWQLSAIGLFLVTCGVWYGKAWAGRTYAHRDAARQLTRLLPPGIVVVGNDAPALCLDTPWAAAPVQPGLSNDDHPVERLRANAVAVTRAPAWQAWWRAHYPGVVQPSHRLTSVTEGGYRRYVVDVYAVSLGKP